MPSLDAAASFIIMAGYDKYGLEVQIAGQDWTWLDWRAKNDAHTVHSVLTVKYDVIVL